MLSEERYCEVCEANSPDIGIKWSGPLRVWLCDSCATSDAAFAVMDMTALEE